MKFMLSLLLPWALSNVDKVLEQAIPAVAEHAGLDDQAADLLVAVVPTIIDGAREIAATKPNLSTEEGAAIVVAEVIQALDAADDLPIWNEWTEAERDKYIEALGIVVLGTLRMARGNGKPKRVLRRHLQRVVLPAIKKRLVA